MRKTILSFFVLWICFVHFSHAQNFANFSSDYSNFGRRVCLVQTVVDTIAPSITIQFLDAPQNTLYNTSVYRRALNGTAWTLKVAGLPPGTASWTDTDVAQGDAWEYQVRRNNTWTYAGVNYNAIGYTCGVVKYDQSNYKGQMILLVAQNISTALPAKITRLKKELTGDGWFVNVLTVKEAYGWDSGDTVVAVRNQIISLYNSCPANDKPKSLFILGHVPLPRSGSRNLTPDGHPVNAGARGADSYYADVNGVWTDAATYNPGGLQTPLAGNLPGDFKFDQDALPSDVEMAFGRVDFRDLTTVAGSEVALTEQYLDRLHNYRTVAPGFFMGSKTTFDFGYDNSNDQSLRTLPNISTADSVYENGAGNLYTASYLNSNGPFAVNMQNRNVPLVSDWNTYGMPATIFSSDQSYWGFGDVPETNYPYSTIRALLGVNTKCLVTLWTTTGANQFHRLGIGESMGESLKEVINHNSTNNYLERPQQQWDTEDWFYRTFLTMYGDPTIRIYQVAPASNAQLTNTGGIADLSWTASPDTRVIGYHIYKSDSEFGKYTRITTVPVAGTHYNPGALSSPDWYMIRPVMYQKTGNGIFINPGEGIFASAATVVPVTWLSFTAQKKDKSVLLQWATASEQNSNNFIVQKSADKIAWKNIGAVPAAGISNNTTQYSLTDPAPAQGINYYRIAQKDMDGKITLSEIRALQFDGPKDFELAYNTVTNGTLKLRVHNRISLGVYNTKGQLLQTINAVPGIQTLDVSALAKGIYFIKGTATEKFIVE